MTIRGLGGQVPPRADQEYRGAQAVVVAPGSSNIVRATQVVVFGTGAGTGLFVYNGTPALGNPPIFWATSAAADPFGNVIPSTAGVAGTGLFEAGNTIVNRNGIFTYSALPPALGGLISSAGVTAAGTDSAGNAYLPGTTNYTNNGGFFSAVNLNSGVVNWYESATAAGPWTAFTGIGFGFAGSVGTMILTGANIQAQGSSTVSLGLAGSAVWNEGTQQLSLPAGGGPFVTGTGYTGIGLPAGLSGGFFVRLEPNNTVRIRAKLSWTTTSATTFTLTGSLPSAAYYPTATILCPLTNNATPSALAAPARIFIATSGAPQVIVPATTGGATTASCDYTYANN